MFGQLTGVSVNGWILGCFPLPSLAATGAAEPGLFYEFLVVSHPTDVFRLTAGGPSLYILELIVVIAVWQRWPSNNTGVHNSFSHSFPNTFLLCPTPTRPAPPSASY